MKNVTKLLAMVMALLMVLGMVPAMAEEAAAAPTAYIMFANSDWSTQYWYDGNEYAGVTATNAAVTGEGDYTVGLQFENASEGVAFMALGLKDGETAFPKHYLKINEIRVNGAAIEVGKGYTSSDDGVETRMNVMNEWVSELPADARSYDGNVADASWIIVDKNVFTGVTSIEIDFTFLKYGIDTAYIMFADSSWAQQYWLDGNEYGGVTVKNAEVKGAGDYSVGLDFSTTEAGKATGVAFTALGIKHGESLFPGMMIKINDIRINGESVAFTKGYTSSDDGVETRMNIMNEWVPSVNTEDPTVRSWDGNLDGAAPIIVSKDDFAEVVTYEIDFSLIPVTDTAYIMFADTAWTAQYWLDGNEYAGVTATNAKIEGPGTYTVGLTFDAPTAGVAFAALGIKTGENTFPGYYIDVKEVKINGAAVELGKGYTSSDDGVETRVNIMNEWVGEVPADARRADGDLEGVTPIVVSKDAMAAVESIEVTFEYIYGEPAAAEGPAPLTEEEVAELIAKDYNAYVAVQSESYIFRNDWYEASYGLNGENPEFFNRLTGWDAENNAVDYGGTFVDAAITGNGTYTATMTTGDHGFGVDTLMHFFRISTDVPSQLVEEGYVTFTDVKVKIGDGKTQDGVVVRTEGDYVELVVIDEYNGIEPGYNYMPGANTLVTFTFTVNGLAD